MPKISILLTSYNHEKYLREAIDSVLAQTYSDFELIIWDDASSDNSWAIIKSYSDKRIKAFRNEKNRLPHYGVNKTISEIAEGEYFAMHHSDDVWAPEKLQKQVEYLDSHPLCGAVFTRASTIGEDGLPLNDSKHMYSTIFDQPNRPRQEWLHHFFFRGNALCHPSVLIRKQCYNDCGLYNDMLAQLPDFDMWVRLCFKYEIHVLPDRLVKFRVRDGEVNQSGNRPETRIRFRSEFHLCRKHFLRINTFDELVTIFPEAEKFRSPNGCEPKFVVAMMALRDASLPWTKLLGIETLFDLLADPDAKKRVELLYQFTHRDFIELTGKHDVFYLETAAIQGSELARRDAVISGQTEQIEQLTRSLRVTNLAKRNESSLTDAHKQGLAEDRRAYEMASHLLDSGHIDEGKAMLAALAEKGSTCWEVFNDIAVQHFNGGDYEQAEQYFLKSMAIEGTAGATARNFASMLLMKGDVEGALAVLGGVLHERPHDDSVLDIVREVLSNINPIPPTVWQRLVTDLRNRESLGHGK